MSSSSILPSQQQQEQVFNIIVSCDWLLVSGSIFFLIAGILFAKFILLHNNGNQEELKKELEKMMIKGRLEVKKIEQEEQKTQQQQQSEQTTTTTPVDVKNDENKKEAQQEERKTDQQGAAQTQTQPISLQLVPSNSSSCPSHPFSSHIPLGPQIENLTAAHSHPGRFMRSLGCELKMIIVVRRDFKPTESLAASWGSTVATEVVQHIRSSFQEPWMSWLKTWNHMAVAKVAVRVDSADMMNAVIRRAVDVEEKKKELMNREVEKEKSNPWKVVPTPAEKKDDDDNKANENENSNKKNEDDDKKTEEVGEKEVTVKKEEEVSKKEFKNCKFSLPVCGLVMTDIPQQDSGSATQNNKKSSKKAGPTPPSSKKGGALDVSKKQFSILSSKDLLALQISSTTTNHQQQQQFDVPCLAIGPCPVDYFVGVTDTLKLY